MIFKQVLLYIEGIGALQIHEGQFLYPLTQNVLLREERFHGNVRGITQLHGYLLYTRGVEWVLIPSTAHTGNDASLNEKMQLLIKTGVGLICVLFEERDVKQFDVLVCSKKLEPFLNFHFIHHQEFHCLERLKQREGDASVFSRWY